MTSSVGHIPINKILFLIKRLTFVELALNDRFLHATRKAEMKSYSSFFSSFSLFVFNIVKCLIWLQKSLLKKYKCLYYNFSYGWFDHFDGSAN